MNLKAKRETAGNKVEKESAKMITSATASAVSSRQKRNEIKYRIPGPNAVS